MTFEGFLWLTGIGAFMIFCIWLLIQVCFHLEAQDARNGRQDLDDDTHLPFH